MDTWDSPPPMVMTPGQQQAKPQRYLPAPKPKQNLQQEYVGGGIFSGVTVGPALDEEVEQAESQASLPLQGQQMPGQSVKELRPPQLPDLPDNALPYQPAMMIPQEHPVQHGMGQVIQGEEAHTLGLSIVGTAVGAILGAKYGGGVYGSLAGALLAGAGINAIRALLYLKDGTNEGDKEAKISGTYAIGAATIGAYIWAKWVSPKKEES